MKCLSCDCDMIKIQRGKPLSNDTMEHGSNAESIVYDINYGKIDKILDKVMESKGTKLYITPEMYVCPKCGEIKQVLNKADLELVLELEGN